MNQTIKQTGVLRLQQAIEKLEDKMSTSKIISAEDGLSDVATRIDTEILKALKSENKTLKTQQTEAKKQVSDLINQLKQEL